MASAGQLKWKIADWCNYACSYCSEGRFAPNVSGERHASDAVIGGVERLLPSLDGEWTVRLSSGEPSTHPKLLEIAEMVSRSGHRVAMETNLSLPLERYERFVAAAAGRLAYIHASLHLDYASPRDFLAKCLALRDRIGRVEGAGLWIATVALPENVERVDQAVALFALSGIEVHRQGTFIEGDRRSFKGERCLAGRQWLLLDMKGDLWRCDNGPLASAGGAAAGLLGSVVRGDAVRHDQARACEYDSFCFCPSRPITEADL